MQQAHIVWQKNGHAKIWQELANKNQYYDVVVVGGGITGAGIALEAVKHGQKVLLVERQDFSWGTSSRSSKMVHGGLRYMAQGDIKTTRESVQERERLLREAPGLVELMEYVMPHYKGQFPPPFLFNALLWVYDLFARKRYRNYRSPANFLPENSYLLAESLVGATAFSDAVTDDSRLVMRVLQEAISAGGDCVNYVAAESLVLKDSQVSGVVLSNQLTGATLEIQASVVINATGAWADELRGQLQQPKKIRPSRGSHLVIAAEKLPVKQSLTILHPKDQRPIFVYPWEGRTVIGTTDIDHGQLNNTEASISKSEYAYLLELANHYFPKLKLSDDDIIATFSGVRPLIASGALNPSKEKRSHSVWHEHGLISVSGGKLTTFRIIAQDALKQAQQYLQQWQPHAEPRILTKATCEHAQFLQLPELVQRRLLGFYGHWVSVMFTDISDEDLQLVEGTQLLWFELRLAARLEAVQHLDDLLLRRTRLGLLCKDGGAAHFDRIQPICQQELGWDAAQWQQEQQRYQLIIQKYYSIPTA